MSLFGGEEKAILKAMGYFPTKEVISLLWFSFPEVAKEKARKQIGCTDAQMELVEIALLDYFLEVKLNHDVPVTNKNADILWQMFLLDTKAYMRFCSVHIGFYIHYTPHLESKDASRPDSHDEEDRLERIWRNDPLYFRGKRRRVVADSERDDLHTYLPMYTVIDAGDSSAYGYPTPSRESSTACHSEPVDLGNSPCEVREPCSSADHWSGRNDTTSSPYGDDSKSSSGGHSFSSPDGESSSSCEGGD